MIGWPSSIDLFTITAPGALQPLSVPQKICTQQAQFRGDSRGVGPKLISTCHPRSAQNAGDPLYESSGCVPPKIHLTSTRVSLQYRARYDNVGDSDLQRRRGASRPASSRSERPHSPSNLPRSTINQEPRPLHTTHKRNTTHNLRSEARKGWSRQKRRTRR